MRVELSVDTRQLENKLYLLAKQARVAPGVVIKEETKYLVKNIMQLTPPNTPAQGKGAVKNDLRKIAEPLDPEQLEGQGEWGQALAAMVRKQNVLGIQALLGNVKGYWKNAAVISDEGTLASSHIRNRNAKGRTYRMRQVALPKMWAAYVKKIQTRVMWAKSGFVAAADKCGLSVPGYLRALAARAGQCVANFGENPSVFVIAHNNKIPGFQKTVKDAVNNRIRVTMTKINRLVAGKAVNLGFMTVEKR